MEEISTNSDIAKIDTTYLDIYIPIFSMVFHFESLTWSVVFLYLDINNSMRNINELGTRFRTLAVLPYFTFCYFWPSIYYDVQVTSTQACSKSCQKSLLAVDIEGSDALSSYLEQKGIFPDRSEKQMRLYFWNRNTTINHGGRVGGREIKRTMENTAS